MDEPGRTRRAIAALRRLDSGERLIELARAGRRRLPGDHEYGDPLPLTGDEPPQVVGRGLSALAEARPSALREVGMGALQVWQSLSEAQGRGHGDRDVAILFTDLVDFSDWVLEAGDERAVELVREVGSAVEGAVRAHGGFRTRGRLVRPAGVAAAQGCRGTVTVQVKAGRRTISARRARLGRSCRFSSRVVFRRPARLGRGRLKFVVRFAGNRAVAPGSARTVRVRAHVRRS